MYLLLILLIGTAVPHHNNHQFLNELMNWPFALSRVKTSFKLVIFEDG